MPASNRPEDIAAARAATFAVSEKNCWSNTWFADPMIFGRYPDDGLNPSSTVKKSLPGSQARA
jgi:beta-glucosidase